MGKAGVRQPITVLYGLVEGVMGIMRIRKDREFGLKDFVMGPYGTEVRLIEKLSYEEPKCAKVL